MHPDIYNTDEWGRLMRAQDLLSDATWKHREGYGSKSNLDQAKKWEEEAQADLAVKAAELAKGARKLR